jgi:hypothetical protein
MPPRHRHPFSAKNCTICRYDRVRPALYEELARLQEAYPDAESREVALNLEETHLESHVNGRLVRRIAWAS